MTDETLTTSAKKQATRPLSNSLNKQQKTSRTKRSLSLGKAIGALHWLLLGLIYGYLSLKAFLEFTPIWDFLAYHLPGALSRFGLTTLTLSPKNAAIIAGFPPLANISQGLLVLLSNRISAAQGINIIAFVSMTAMLARLLGAAFPPRWFLTYVLAVPMIVLHLHAGYIDLWSNTFITLAFAGIISAGMNRKLETAAGAVLLGVGGAVLSKYQMWPAAGVLAAISMYIFSRKKLPWIRYFNATLLLLIVAWPLRNALLLGNPFFPAVLPFMSEETPGNKKLISEESNRINTPMLLWDSAQPVRFAASVFELNRLASSKKPFRWTLDQGIFYAKSKSPHHRMGGWFFLTSALLSVLLMISFSCDFVSPGEKTLLSILVILTSFLPQSHELRYFMYVPMCAAVLATIALERFPYHMQYAFKAALFGATCYVLVKLLFPLSISVTAPEEYAPRVARNYWAKSKKEQTMRCVNISEEKVIYFAGPTFNEFPVVHCW